MIFCASFAERDVAPMGRVGSPSLTMRHRRHRPVAVLERSATSPKRLADFSSPNLASST